jgi:hypothetical protein
VVASTAGEELTSVLLFLAMVERPLGSFVAVVDNKTQFCYVCRADGVLVFVVVADELQKCRHEFLEQTVSLIAKDAAEILKTNSCPTLRDTSTAPVLQWYQSVLGSSAALCRRSEFETLASELNFKDVVWFCLQHGVLSSSEQNFFSNFTPPAIGLACELVRGMTPGLSFTLRGEAHTVSEALAESWRSSPPRGDGGDGGGTIVQLTEIWMPLLGGWLYVCSQHGRTVTVLFPSSFVGDMELCFHRAEQIVHRMFNGSNTFGMFSAQWHQRAV